VLAVVAERLCSFDIPYPTPRFALGFVVTVVFVSWASSVTILSLLSSVVVLSTDELEQHLCLDKGYDYPDVHDFVEQERYIAHIKHRRRRNEPLLEYCPVPGETQFPARRWVVERTFGWLAKRRSLRTRWAKKPQNWLALVQFACAHILMNMAIFG